jgi:Zn-dependent metalloprotease
MTKTAAHFVALAFLKKKRKATPAQINDHVGKGNYASKYICYLKLEGYEIETVKNGKTVVEYKYISDGDSANRNYQWVPPAQRGKVKTVKAPSRKAQAAVTAASKAVKARKAARNVLKDAADMQADALLNELGMKNAGEYASGVYSVDPDWDSIDDHDIANLLK